MAAALTLSAASMLAHNPYELPLSTDRHREFRPDRVRGAPSCGVCPLARSKVAAAAFGWGVLNLVIGGIVTVLPLAILPFVPEQSVTHYAAHVVYALGQFPLVVLGYRALRAPTAAGDRVWAPTMETRGE
jgi:hypothetical protein